MAGLAVRGAVIGVLSGLIVPNAVSIIRNLVTTGEFKSDLSPMQNLANILNGVIFGALFGICAATFIAYGIIAGVAVSINFGLSYKYFIDGQNAAANGQWDIAIYSWFFALFYLIAGFTTISFVNLSTQDQDNDSDSSYTANPYSYLEDEPNVGPGKIFSAKQKEKMLLENMKRNNGVVMSDNPNDPYYGQELVKPLKSMKGVSPLSNEWQFDHITPKSQGETNSYSNCQIVSRQYNRDKWDS